MKSVRVLVGLALIASSMFGCGGTKTKEGPTIRVAAASDLQRALPILAARFKLDTGIQVVSTMGSSGTLAEQIKQGAPFDLFLSANRDYAEELGKSGFIDPSSLKPYARGTLSLVTRKDRDDIKSLADLEKKEVQTFAIANPSHAPYGLAAKQVLEKAKLWDKLESKRVLASNVREALQFVESGNADAAFVGRALAVNSKVKVIPIRPDDHEPIVQYLGVVSKTKSRGEADRFAAFMTGEVGQGMLRDLGFSTVPTDPPVKPKEADVH